MRIELRALRLTLLARLRFAVSRARRTHSIAVATPTPKRSAAPRAENRVGVHHPVTQILAVSPRHHRLRRFAAEDSHASPQPGIPLESESTERALGDWRLVAVDAAGGILFIFPLDMLGPTGSASGTPTMEVTHSRSFKPRTSKPRSVIVQ